MPEYLSPGVYVEEVSFRAKSLEGVSTSTTGFTGLTSSTSASRMMRRGSYCRGSSFFQSTSSNSGPISSRIRSFAPSAIVRSARTIRASWAA